MKKTMVQLFVDHEFFTASEGDSFMADIFCQTPLTDIQLTLLPVRFYNMLDLMLINLQNFPHLDCRIFHFY